MMLFSCTNCFVLLHKDWFVCFEIEELVKAAYTIVKKKQPRAYVTNTPFLKPLIHT